MSRRCRWRCGRRDHKSDPGIPAFGPVLSGELLVSLEVQVALHVADREDEPKLRANAENLRLEAADTITRAAVATDFLVDVSDETNHERLAQELGRTPVKMQVHAVLVL